MEILHKQLHKMCVSVCVSLCEIVGHITLPGGPQKLSRKSFFDLRG